MLISIYNIVMDKYILLIKYNKREFYEESRIKI